MIEKSLDSEVGCQEYCKPLHETCMKNEKDEDRCEKKREECLSFCKFA